MKWLITHNLRHSRAGAKTGRTPKDKRVVREPESEADIWWAGEGGSGSPNYEMDERTFLLNRERAVDYLNMLDRIYVFDGYAGWDPEVRRNRTLPHFFTESLCIEYETVGCIGGA